MKSIHVLFILIIIGGTLQSQPIFSSVEGAIKGYDPVAYFTKGEPVKGFADFVYDWNEVRWYFSSEEHMKTFKNNPGKYAPQYGGSCAYGLANGYKVKIEPEACSIIDDKLYLNYDLGVQKKWEKNGSAYILEANANWPALKNDKVK